MIPGFNTDIEHGGVTYHVQTEDKGVDSPMILSLVYQGGAILASKRTPYEDLLTAALDETVLAERLGKQHKLICAAIRQGRIEDLKRMNDRGATTAVENESAARDSGESRPPAESPSPVTPARPPVASTAHVIKSGVADFIRRETVDGVPTLTLLGDAPIRAGETVSLEVRLTNGDGSRAAALTGVKISVKVLGTAFSLIEASAETGADGVAKINLSLPSFKTGRAVLMISATHGEHEVVLRRIVLPA